MKTLKKIKFEILFIYLLIIFSAVIAPYFMIANKDSLYTYLLKPIIWVCIFLIAGIITLEDKTRISQKREIIKNIFIVTLLYLVTYYILGVFVGYTKSIYSHTFLSIMKNIWAFPMVLGLQEYVRTSLVYSSNKKWYSFCFITLIFIFTDIDYNTLINNFKDAVTAFEYICSSLVPTVVKSALYTYIAYYGGYLASTQNRIIVSLVSVLTPVYPDIDWFLNSMFEILTPFLIFLTVNSEIKKREIIEKSRKSKKDNDLKLIPFFAIVIAFILFVAGFFDFKPVSIASNSMQPAFSRGAVTIAKKIKEQDFKNLKVGDIIEYRIDNKVVIHRIHEIIDNENFVYRTKGDNNNSPDAKLVQKNQVLAQIKLYIPYIGYPSVWLSEVLKNGNAPEGIELGNKN